MGRLALTAIGDRVPGPTAIGSPRSQVEPGNASFRGHILPPSQTNLVPRFYLGMPPFEADASIRATFIEEGENYVVSSAHRSAHPTTNGTDYGEKVLMSLRGGVPKRRIIRNALFFPPEAISTRGCWWGDCFGGGCWWSSPQ
ncbi:MAG: hypothetical protein GDA43_14550 [Hormoscilla sp. SP5CHS1]|nr:hypothetical protein [Hormoscilla sp. SP5CHS1]